MQARLQRRLQVAEQIERELQVAREIFFGELLRDFGELGLFGGRGRDQARGAARDPGDQQVADVAGELARMGADVVVDPGAESPWTRWKDLANPDGALRPGMYVNARVGVELHRDALLVPAGALVREKAAGFLFLLADGKASRVAVKYGFNDGVSVEILEGIPADARVIIPGKAALVSGQPVKVVEAK